MHVLIATRSTLHNGVAGGMEAHTDLLARGLVSRGAHVTILTTAHPHGEDRIADGGVVTRFLPGTPPGRYSRAFDAAQVPAIRDLTDPAPVDVVLGQSVGARAYARATRRDPRRAPVAAIYHGTASWEIRSHWAAVDRLAEVPGALRGTLRMVPEVLGLEASLKVHDRIVAVSGALGADLRASDPGPPDHVQVIPNGIELPADPPDRDIHRERFRAGREIPGPARILVMAGRLSREKGFHVGLEAWGRLASRTPDAWLLIAGDGPERGRLEDLAQTLETPGRVRFTGRLPRRELTALFQAADGILLPSLRWEGLPMTLLEAMACGLPAVGSRRGGIPEALRDGETGWLTEPGDPRDLTRALEELLDDPARARARGRRARRAIRDRFTAEKMVGSYQTLIEDLTGADRAAGDGTCNGGPPAPGRARPRRR